MNREKINLDPKWLFHKGDLPQEYPAYKGFAYISAKTERMHMGPACKNYYASTNSFRGDQAHNADRWIEVNLPHDYGMEEEPRQENNQAFGFVKVPNAWYIKKFELSAADRNKRITLLFEGIATHATVYLNGCLMKHNFCGYTSFEVDITDVVKYESVNTLSVYVNATEREGWWYEGGGIYRHVWLCKTDLISVDLWGIYVSPRLTGNGLWEIPTEVTVRNDSDRDRRIRVEATVFDPKQNSVVTECVSGLSVRRGQKLFRLNLQVQDPSLWSPEHPEQYRMEIRIFSGNIELDCDSVRFGFRTVRMDSDQGLFINEQYYKINGVCGHITDGLFGKAIPDNIFRHRVQLFREMGANGYRTSHYPQPEVLMDALDENGFLVMDETRWFESTDEGKAQLEMLIKRDRNRPGVIFWSIGNEEPHHTTEEGRRITRSLLAFVRKLDPSRPVVCAVDKPEKATVFEDIDVIGINYCYQAFDSIHQKFPSKPMLSAENSATGSTRGWYFPPDDSRACLPAYDRDFNSWFISREKTWSMIAARNFVMGGYQWMSIDHRGEAVWPRLCSVSGAIDMFYQKKDAFYQNLSFWSTEPMIHLLPHWNFRGLEGTPIRVVTYSNADEAELFLNGISQGRQTIERCRHGEWMVPYRPGKLEAFAYRNGKQVAYDCQITSEAPAKLMLTLETPEITANGRDMALVTCSVTDRNGIEVPDASAEISFAITSDNAAIYSTGSDISDHTSPFLPCRKMIAGRITVAIQICQGAEEICLFVTSPMLDSAMLKFHPQSKN